MIYLIFSEMISLIALAGHAKFGEKIVSLKDNQIDHRLEFMSWRCLYWTQTIFVGLRRFTFLVILENFELLKQIND